MIKLLILSTNPKNTAPLRLSEEVREIQAAIARCQYRDRIEIVTRSAVRVSDLQPALLSEKPQIVHFSGHGAGSQGLALENAAGQMQLVSTEALGNLFDLLKHEVDCVVLNACHTQAQLAAIHQHIDTVIGMNQAIGDRAAIQFALGFYEALGSGEDYEQAYRFGCNAIELQGIPEALTPVLKTRNGDKSPLLASLAEDQTIAPESPEKVLSDHPQTVTMNAKDHAKQFAQFVNQGGTVNFN